MKDEVEAPLVPQSSALFRILLLATIAAVLLFLFHRVMAPAPIPALGAVASGLLACVLRANWRRLGFGTLAGLSVGACLHAYSHFAEGRAESVSHVFGHVAADAAIGLVIALVVLGVVVAVDRTWFSRARVPPALTH